MRWYLESLDILNTLLRYFTIKIILGLLLLKEMHRDIINDAPNKSIEST